MYGSHSADVEARITFLRPEEGGRSSSFSTGYRPQFYYEGLDYDAIQEYPERAEVYPGETVTVLLHFLHPELLHTRLKLGDSFLIREGSVMVGHGVVRRILDLEKNAILYG
jgi:translation elongation factor EF-Tu-like GTPase